MKAKSKPKNTYKKTTYSNVIDKIILAKSIIDLTCSVETQY